MNYRFNPFSKEHKHLKNTFYFSLKLLSICTLILYSSSVKSQAFEPVRIELTANIEAPSYHVESLGSKGLLLFYESNEIEESQKRRWYFSLLDTTLTEKWVQIVPLTDGLIFHSAYINSETVVILFTGNTKSKSQNISYEIISLEIESNKFNLFGGSIPEKAEIAGFAANNFSAMLAVNLPKSKSDFLYFDLKKGEVVSKSQVVEGKSIVNELKIVNGGSFYIAAVSQSSDNEPLKYFFVVFDSFGTILRSFEHLTASPRSLHSFTFNYDSTNQGFIIVGSFDYELVKKDKQKSIVENEDDGLFYLRFSDNASEVANFIDFKDFKNIYAALTAEDLMMVRQKQSNTNDESPIKPEISFTLFNPNSTRFEDKWVFSAEAFRPQYRMESRMEYDFYGRPIPYTYSVFEGYNFFTTIIAAFDKNGQLNWSNSFEIPNALSFFLQPHTLIQVDSTNINVCLVNNGLVHSSVFNNEGNEIGSLEQTKIVTDFSNDRLIEEDFTSIIHWYDDFYIANGYQKITNNKLGTNNPRTIFFLNKLDFR